MPYLSLFAVAWLIFDAWVAYPQAYKWTDEEGAVHYTDKSYEAGKQSSGNSEVVVLGGGKPKSAAPAPTVFEAPVDEEIAPAPAAENESPGKKGVVLVGDFEIALSLSGRAMIRATLKNEFDRAVGGIRLDVILFHVKRSRAADLIIPFEAGKVKPDRLDPGETGTIEYETDFMPEEIAGYRYRVVWAYNELAPAPPEGEEPAEGVTHVIRNKKTGKARLAGEESESRPEQNK